jgi:hypothetical protein
MKIIAWCYNCQQQISFDNGTRNRNGVAVPVDDYGNLHSCKHKIESLDFKVRNVSDVDKSYILMKITGQFRESIFHWIGIRANDMSVMRRQI